MSPDSGVAAVGVDRIDALHDLLSRDGTSNLETSVELLRTISEVLDIRGVFPRVSEIVTKVLPHDHLQLIFRDQTGHLVIEARSTEGFPDFNRVTATELLGLEEGFRIVGDLTTARPLIVEADLQDRVVAAGFRSFLSVYTSARKQEMILAFLSKRTNAFSRDDVPIARLVADYVALAVSHEQLAEAERRVAEAYAREERLKASEQELRGIVDAIPHTIIVLSPDGTPLYGNRFALEYTGLTIEEITAGGRRFLHPEDVTRVQDERREGLSRGVPFEVESRVRRKDGEYRWFLIRYHPSCDEQGPILRWYATGTDIDDRKQGEERRVAEARAREERLERRVKSLVAELDLKSGLGRAIGESAEWKGVLKKATQVAETNTTVLLQGESGTGKEVVARFIHRASPRKEGPFVAINCAALPEQLLESELFGHERGAFTGAVQSKPGQIEMASGGVLFLDEVSEMSSSAQAKFLRVLQEREFQRLGSTRVLKAQVRVIAATNRDLRQAVERGEFREDLYYRLQVFEIRLPPLRDRRSDVLPLAEAFVQDIARSFARPPAGLTSDAKEALLAHRWPGNVRELRNALERAAILSEGGLITAQHLAPESARPGAPSATTDLNVAERHTIEQVMRETRGNKAEAARRLGITRIQLYTRLRKHGLDAGLDVAASA